MNERQLQQLENDGLSDVVELINSQKQRIAELTAHVERLHEFFHDHVPNYEETIEVYTPDLYDLLDETPAQSLNEIKAQAIEEACNACMTLTHGSYEYLTLCDVENYAKQLRGEGC